MRIPVFNDNSHVDALSFNNSICCTYRKTIRIGSFLKPTYE